MTIDAGVPDTGRESRTDRDHSGATGSVVSVPSWIPPVAGGRPSAARSRESDGHDAVRPVFVDEQSPARPSRDPVDQVQSEPRVVIQLRDDVRVEGLVLHLRDPAPVVGHADLDPVRRSRRRRSPVRSSGERSKAPPTSGG